jgi:sensor domain CHASE-containing protein
MPSFDTTINLGTILHLAGMIVLVISVYTRLRVTIEYQGSLILELKADLKSIRDDLIRDLEKRISRVEGRCDATMGHPRETS